MPRNNPACLWGSLIDADRLSSRVSVGAHASASWGELSAAWPGGERKVELRGRSVLLATIDQFAAVAALIQLDGVVRRIVLYPPDTSPEHLACVAQVAAADLVVTDRPEIETFVSGIECVFTGDGDILSRAEDRSSPIETEWILLTSGTTGVPKLVRHTLATLTGAMQSSSLPTSVIWSTLYDIRRYGGLQIFLRAALAGTPLLLPGTQEPTPDFLARAGELGITHISGTPSHWRRALRSGAAGRIAPAYVRLSGEIADQGILNQLREQYPQARIAHAFASTEAGVAFEVNDGLAGVPSGVIEKTPGVEMKVEGGTLRIRSNRTASYYLGEDTPPLKDAEGFVDTGDVVELQAGRYTFGGRRDGTINVGGFKVHPEEVEVVLNRHPEVSLSLVRGKKNPVTGTLVVADVVLKQESQPQGSGTQAMQREILQFCRGELALHKVPAAINFVASLPMAETGKLIRRYA